MPEVTRAILIAKHDVYGRAKFLVEKDEATGNWVVRNILPIAENSAPAMRTVRHAKDRLTNYHFIPRWYSDYTAGGWKYELGKALYKYLQAVNHAG